MKNIFITFVKIIVLISTQNILIAQSPCLPICPVRPDPKAEPAPPPVLPPINFTDCDNNGISDEAEGEGDTNNNGIPDSCDPDNDGDGVLDQNDACISAMGTANGCPTEADKYRQVFFVHGMKGTEESWVRARSWSATNYKSFFPVVEYANTQQSIETSTASLADEIRTKLQVAEPLWKKKNNYIIAHSLGGVVSRHLQNLMDNPVDQMPFDGIVTFGTPHQGAVAADNKVNRPWMYEDFINEACNKIGGVFARSIVSESKVLGLLSPLLSMDSLIFNTCDNLSGIAFAIAESSMSAGVQAELVTSNASSYPEPITRHNVAFYGVENQKAMFARFMGTNIEKINDFNTFGAGASDQVGIEFFDNLKETILNKLTNSLCAPLTTAKLETARACREALEYLSRIDAEYKALIGVIQNTVESYQLYCHKVTNNGTIVTPITNYSECTCTGTPGCISTYVTNDVTYTYVLRDSDAFVLAESAMNFPGASRGPVKMDGSNHFQMRNDGNTKTVLEENLYLGNYGSYFFINRK